MVYERRTFWQAPSGRIHSMRLCSGTGQPGRKVSLTKERYEQAVRCRCARWTER